MGRDLYILQFLILQLSGSIDVPRIVDPILISISRYEIPFEEKGVILDMVKEQIRIPVKIPLTEDAPQLPESPIMSQES